MLEKLLFRINTRSSVVIILSVGAVILAVKDPAFRPSFGNIVSAGVGGYLALSIPKKE